MEHPATCASKNRVSRFAVLIADFCNKICQEPTLARGLVKHVIRAHEQRLWQINSDSLCGSGVDHQFEFRWLLHWHVGRLSALQKLGRDGAGLPPQLD